MNITLDEVITWLIVGALAGSAAGMLVVQAVRELRQVRQNAYHRHSLHRRPHRNGCTVDEIDCNRPVQLAPRPFQGARTLLYP
jgi:hypothetical protein